MKQIVLASNNDGKIQEFSALFSQFGLNIITLKEAGATSDVEETGLTFIENAILKARHAAKITGLPALADDSGLVVPALQGAPGIYSARFSPEGGDENNNKYLLKKMKDLPSHQRIAHFTCILALLRHDLDPNPIIVEGKVNGEILENNRGSGGFGYDPLFFISSLKQTFAEISVHDKNTISHRAKAMQKLIPYLQTEFRLPL